MAKLTFNVQCNGSKCGACYHQYHDVHADKYICTLFKECIRNFGEENIRCVICLVSERIVLDLEGEM